VCKSEEETQLQSKGVLVKGFGYLLEAYLGLVVRYPILVRVSGLSSDYLLFGEISLERDIVLVDESILKKLCCYPRFLGITRRSCLEAHRS
jgi:hypothetical protein